MEIPLSNQGQSHGMALTFFLYTVEISSPVSHFWYTVGICIYISAMDHDRKLKFSSSVHLRSINTMLEFFSAM